MALRATKPPDQLNKRLMLLLFGDAGTGKTTAGIQFPRPYILDCIEHGTDHYRDLINASQGHVFHCPDIHEAIAEVKALGTDNHPFLSLVIDAFTNLYQVEGDRQEARVGNEFQKHLLEANKPTRRLFNLAMKLNMNFIVTCHSKNAWNEGKVDGTTWDGWKKMNYPFDLVLELHKAKKPDAPRLATVRKTRISAFPEGETFKFSYQEIVKRYPYVASTALASTVKFASPAQLDQLNRLLAAAQMPSDTLDKWLSKAGADTIEDMPAETVVKCLAFLADKLQLPKAS